MATIEVKHDPAFDCDKLYAFLKPRLNGKYTLQQTFRRQTALQERLHGMQWVVVVKKNAWFGAHLLVKQRPNRTQIKIWADPPSERVFLVFVIIPILIPLLIFVLPIIKIGSRPIVKDVRACLKEMRVG
jgi:hypothetical protein